MAEVTRFPFESTETGRQYEMKRELHNGVLKLINEAVEAGLPKIEALSEVVATAENCIEQNEKE